MSSAAPDPMKIVVLAAVGVGVYWFMSRRAVAAAPVAAGLPPSQYRADAATGLASVLTAVGGLFRAAAPAIAPGTYDGRSAQPWDTTPSYGAPGVAYNNPSAYVASSAVDGLPINPVGGALFPDYPDYGMSTGGNGAWL